MLFFLYVCIKLNQNIMTTTITYRELLPSEAELLKTFVYEAIFVPEGVEPPEFEIVF